MAPKALLSKPHPEVVSILVGPDQRQFVVHRKLLCDSSSFFRDSIDAVPEGLTSPSSSPSSSSSKASAAAASSPRPPLIIWLAGESAGVFELFVLWLYRRHGFRTIIEEAAAILASRTGQNERITLCPPEPTAAVPSSPVAASPAVSPAAQACSTLQWNLVHLHLFAAMTDIPALQDAAMDALQDLYLRFDWEATPVLIRFLYAECDSFAACRLRKWAVALLAWTLANRGGSPAAGAATTEEGDAGADADVDADADAETDATFHRLLAEFPALQADYEAHLAKMLVSRADVRIKNPQLRIQSNHLRRSDRHFGFRQCSFHSHRRSVGEGRCPHSLAAHGRSASNSSGHSGRSAGGESIGSNMSRMPPPSTPKGATTATSPSSRSLMTTPAATGTPATAQTAKTTQTAQTTAAPVTGRSTPNCRWGVVLPSRLSTRSSTVPSAAPSATPEPRRTDWRTDRHMWPRAAAGMAPLGMECTI